MKDQTVLDQVKIASPCRARWEDMAGDERARFCGQCRKHVFNLSAMSRGEIEALIREKEGRFCGRFHARADGRMLTRDCPTGRERRRNWWLRAGGSVCAFLVFVLSGCSRRGSPPTLLGDVCIPPPGGTNLQVRLGEVSPAGQTAGTNAPEIMGKIYVPTNTHAPDPNSR